MTDKTTEEHMIELQQALDLVLRRIIREELSAALHQFTARLERAQVAGVRTDRDTSRRAVIAPIRGDSSKMPPAPRK